MTSASLLERLTGLSFSLEELTRMKPHMTRLSREEQSKYADAICRSSVANTLFLNRQCDYMDPVNEDYSYWNTTSIGNIAYILLHGNLTDEQRVKLEKMYEGYVAWEKRGSSTRCIVS